MRDFLSSDSCDPVSVYYLRRGLMRSERNVQFSYLMHLNYQCEFLNFVWP